MALRGHLFLFLSKLRRMSSHTPAAAAVTRNIGNVWTRTPAIAVCPRELTGFSQLKYVDISGCRSFSSDANNLPPIKDNDVESAFKDLMAASWDEIPYAVLKDAGKAIQKTSEDKAGQDVLTAVLRAAVAVEHFAGVLVSLRMELDDSIGLGGEEVGPMNKDLQEALDAAYRRYSTYLEAFDDNEAYLRRKVEVELGTKMIQIKLRCGGLGSEWGKVTVLGTSGLAGSYVEHRTL